MAITAYTNYPTDYRDVSQIVIKDGTGTPQEVTLTLYDSGTLSFAPERDLKVIKHRGAITYVVDGDEMGLPVSFTIPMGEFSSGTATEVTPYEAITGTGNAATQSFITTRTVGYEVHCVDIDFKIQTPGGAAGDYETVTVNDFCWDGLPWSGGDNYNTLEVSGRAYGNATLPTIAHADA